MNENRKKSHGRKYAVHRKMIHQSGKPVYENAGYPPVTAFFLPNSNFESCSYHQDYAAKKWSENKFAPKIHPAVNPLYGWVNLHHEIEEVKTDMRSNLRNEIKAYIVRKGYTMQEVVDLLAADCGWSDSVSNLSNKLQRESLRYVEAVQLADALGYEVVWQPKREQ